MMRSRASFARTLLPPCDEFQPFSRNDKGRREGSGMKKFVHPIRGHAMDGG